VDFVDEFWKSAIFRHVFHPEAMRKIRFLLDDAKTFAYVVGKMLIQNQLAFRRLCGSERIGARSRKSGTSFGHGRSSGQFATSQRVAASAPFTEHPQPRSRRVNSCQLAAER
jgi:hypothetical protein